MPDYDADAERVFECLQRGGIAIVQMDVACSEEQAGVLDCCRSHETPPAAF